MKKTMGLAPSAKTQGHKQTCFWQLLHTQAFPGCSDHDGCSCTHVCRGATSPRVCYARIVVDSIAIAERDGRASPARTHLPKVQCVCLFLITLKAAERTRHLSRAHTREGHGSLPGQRSAPHAPSRPIRLTRAILLKLHTSCTDGDCSLARFCTISNLSIGSILAQSVRTTTHC
jgi:hypothetical protein